MKQVVTTHRIEELFSLKDKVIMIAGGGGLGTCFGKAFLENGAKVVFTARRTVKLDEVEQQLKAGGFDEKDYGLFIMDQRNKAEIEEAVSKAVERFGRIDVMVNTAAIAPNDSAEHFEADIVRNIVDTNLTAAIYTTQVVGNQMIKQGGGKIIEIGSIAGYTTHSYESLPYEATKAGVHQMTKSFATAWGKYNINVNCIAPTWIMTPMLDDEPQRYLDAVNDMHEFERMAETDDLVGAAIFLASDASNYVTGHILFVDGGWSAGKPIVY